MTRSMLAAGVVLALASAGSAPAGAQTKVIDPTGTYAVSTSSDSGQPLTGTMVITSSADGYTGTFSSPALPAPVQVVSVTTNGKQMMATLNNGTGLVLVWLEMGTDGAFKGTWHQLSQGIATTGKKSK